MQLIRTNSWCEVRGAHPSFARGLDKTYSYFQKGYFFSPQYKNRAWDGKVHLIKIKDDGSAVFPGGLWDEVLKRAIELDYEPTVTDLRPEPEHRPALANWSFAHPLRWFQVECEKIATREDVSGGIFNLAPRAGKTLLASRIIHHYQQKTLFLVPTKDLLQQGMTVMQARFPTANVTLLGDGKRDLEGDIVVAIMASVIRRVDEINTHRWGLLILDEAHHCTSEGDKWKQSVLAINARRKFGMTGTLEVPNEKTREAQNGTIWIRGICGPQLYKRTQSDLVDDGALMASTVTILRHDAKPITDGAIWKLAAEQHDARYPEAIKKWEAACARARSLRRRAPNRPKDEVSQAAFQTALYDLGISNCLERNKRMLEAVKERLDQGLLVLIDAQRVEHVKVLYEMAVAEFGKSGIAAVTAKFCKGPFKRPQLIEAFNDRKLKLVIGNLLGEGVDMPNLNVVVNAEGGYGFNAVFQRMRHLNAVEGKTTAELIDFADTHHPQLLDWATKRIEHYGKERAITLVLEPRKKK